MFFIIQDIKSMAYQDNTDDEGIVDEENINPRVMGISIGVVFGILAGIIGLVLMIVYIPRHRHR
jgi:hypothetical protein